MSRLNALLSKRLNKKKGQSKTTALAQKSTNGELSSFAGLFTISDLSDDERSSLEQILLEYQQKKRSIAGDLKDLIAISSEVKAINNQAALLHGERIKKAQEILKKYRDGAFTAWLITTYGNRQTPYNFLQYYEFFDALPKALRLKVEKMPRQAIYTLASREGSSSMKEKLIKKYKGQTKEELLQMIRETFPLSQNDKRRPKLGNSVIVQLQRISSKLARTKRKIGKGDKKAIKDLLETIETLISS